MAFCSECGAPLADGAKFCSKCGAKVINISKDERQTFAGNVRKCPSCGADVSEFDAICPECGHEFNSSKNAESLDKFVHMVASFDQQIDREPKVTGWAVWSTWGKIGWIILNVYCLCIPLIIYKLLRISNTSRKKVTDLERQKSGAILNFAFPNDRSAMLGALNFINQKMEYYMQQPRNKNTLYWTKTWNVKAQQLKSQAKLSIPNDETANKLTTDINLKAQTIISDCKRKTLLTIIAAIGIFLFFSFILSLGGTN